MKEKNFEEEIEAKCRAETYFNTVYNSPDNVCDIELAIRSTYEKAFLAGLKAGKPKWHDLQKAPNDLPPKIKGMCISKYVLSENGTLVYYDYKNKMFATYMIVPTEVIAWCEIPKYTEE